jgi:hypothetical protein
MARITTDAPGVAVPIEVAAVLTTSFVTLLEADDFSVPNPDTGGETERVVAPGQTKIITPMIVHNVTTSTATVDVQWITEGGVTITLATLLPVPARDAVSIPLQGQSLLKLSASSTNGGRLQARASTGAALHIKMMAAQSQADAHAPDTEG